MWKILCFLLHKYMVRMEQYTDKKEYTYAAGPYCICRLLCINTLSIWMPCKWLGECIAKQRIDSKFFIHMIKRCNEPYKIGILCSCDTLVSFWWMHELLHRTQCVVPQCSTLTTLYEIRNRIIAYACTTRWAVAAVGEHMQILIDYIKSYLTIKI